MLTSRFDTCETCLCKVRRRQRDVSLEEVLSEKLVVEFAKDGLFFQRPSSICCCDRISAAVGSSRQSWMRQYLDVDTL